MKSHRNTSGVVAVPIYHYIHVFDVNTNVTRLVVGPRNYVCLRNEEVALGPEKMVILASSEYCVVSNPVKRDEGGKVMYESSGQVQLQLGDLDYRFCQDPFPLFPGEILKAPATPLPVVRVNTALRLRALCDFTRDGVSHVAGDEWLFEGPGVYRPCKEVEVVREVEAQVIHPGTALCLRASRDFADKSGQNRVCGEEWLVTQVGAYMMAAYEEFVSIVKAYQLDEKHALHIRSKSSHVDKFGIQRKCGAEWLVTYKDTEQYMCSIEEVLVGVVDITTLSAYEYCVILNPVSGTGVPQLGKRKLVRGPASFFLMPGESLEFGVMPVYVLGSDEGLLLRAIERFVDNEDDATRQVIRQPGEQWLIRGPREYVPPLSVTIVCRRTLIPLSETEGIYVKNYHSGEVRSIVGSSYMLHEDENHWEKKLPSTVKELLHKDIDRSHFVELHNVTLLRAMKCLSAPIPPGPFPVVSLQVPRNAAVQVVNYFSKTSRVEYGPVFVMLGPHEHFTEISLSGGSPKRPNVVRSLYLLLGPDYFTDLVTVETSDHACLALLLSYNWKFDVPEQSEGECESNKLFSVPDFVGNACKAMGSRIRGAVAAVPFDVFHKNSARIIRVACFGMDKDGRVRDSVRFPQNRLLITTVDIKAVDPTDEQTRNSLMKSVQLAIEIALKSQEATAKHEADRLEQESRGRLERQKILDELEAEKVRRKLLVLQIASAAFETTGQVKAEAIAKAEAERIDALSNVEAARLDAVAKRVECESQLDRLKRMREAELAYIASTNELKIKRKEEEMKVDVSRFERLVQSVGRKSLSAIVCANSNYKQRLLEALNLKSTLITDGSNPINLIQTAHGLIGNELNH